MFFVFLRTTLIMQEERWLHNKRFSEFDFGKAVKGI